VCAILENVLCVQDEIEYLVLYEDEQGRVMIEKSVFEERFGGSTSFSELMEHYLGRD